MPRVHKLETKRLLLRQWRLADYSPFAETNSCKEVMEYFPNRLSRSESDALAARSAEPIEARMHSNQVVNYAPSAPDALSAACSAGRRLSRRYVS